MSGASLIVNNAQITKAQNGVKITATGGGKSGSSNRFNVTPASLAKFAFSGIGSTQDAEVPFPLR
jgi:hypothetical protein